MSPLVPIMMFGWIPFSVMLFTRIIPRKAVVWSFVLAWCFLPWYHYAIPGLPDISKASVACIGIIIGCLMFDTDRIYSFHFHAVDIPAICWCLAPGLASISNDLGLYDAFSATLDQTIKWGLPYFVGRLYFSDKKTMRELVWTLFWAGVIYAPFCLFEARMSPQLHRKIYGFMQIPFAQTIRFGGFRPLVFMQHGLAVAMWMVCSAFCGVWLWYNGQLKGRLFNVPYWCYLGLLMLTILFLRSMGALMILIAACGVMFLAVQFRIKLPMLIFLLIPFFYIGARVSGHWDGMNVVEKVREHEEERAASLEFRFLNENILIEKALQRKIFGWGGWGRHRVYNEEGEDISVTDGFWVIQFGVYGYWGIVSVLMYWLFPAVVFWFKFHGNNWNGREVMPFIIASMLLGMNMIDSLPNSMFNPLFIVIAGGLYGFFTTDTFFEEDEIIPEFPYRVM